MERMRPFVYFASDTKAGGMSCEQKKTVSLTPRESEVLGLMGLGLTNKAIMQELTIAESTVGAHINNINKRLGVNVKGGRHRETVVAAVKQGLLDLESLVMGISILLDNYSLVKRCERLSSEEERVVEEMVSADFPNGNSGHDMANRLHKNAKTVENQYANAVRKVGVRNQTQLAVVYMAHKRSQAQAAVPSHS